MLFFCIFWWGAESCKVHSCAYNECKLAQLRGRKICEKSPTGCFQEVTEWWALQEPELKSSAPQTDQGTAISHCLLTHSAFAGRYPRLHWFICNTINSPNFSLVSIFSQEMIIPPVVLDRLHFWNNVFCPSGPSVHLVLVQIDAGGPRGHWKLRSKKKWHLLVPMRSLIRLHQAFPGP